MYFSRLAQADFLSSTTQVATFTYDALGTVLQEPGDRVTWLYDYYRPQILSRIQKGSQGLLGEEEVRDLFHDTMTDFLALIKRKPLPAEEYLPVLDGIAHNKGVDALCRRKKEHRTKAEQLALTPKDDSQEGEKAGSFLTALKPAESQETREVLLRIVVELPERQRLVATVLIEHFDEFGLRDIYQRLAEMVSAVSGQDEKAKTVKSLWHAARTFIRAALERQGYSPPRPQSN